MNVSSAVKPLYHCYLERGYPVSLQLWSTQDGRAALQGANSPARPSSTFTHLPISSNHTNLLDTRPAQGAGPQAQGAGPQAQGAWPPAQGAAPPGQGAGPQAPEARPLAQGARPLMKGVRPLAPTTIPLLVGAELDLRAELDRESLYVTMQLVTELFKLFITL